MFNPLCRNGERLKCNSFPYYFSDIFKWLFPIGQVTTDMLKSRSQKELLDILNMVKTKEINMHEAELLFNSWQQQYNGGMTRSFRDRRVRRESLWFKIDLNFKKLCNSQCLCLKILC